MKSSVSKSYEEKICFVSPYAYSLFNQKEMYEFGGAEVRAWTLAKGFARHKGYEVSFVVKDHGQSSIEEYDAIKVYKNPYLKELPVSEKVIDHSNSFAGTHRGSNLIKKYLKKIFPELMKQIREKVNQLMLVKRHQIYNSIDADVYFAFGISSFTSELIAFLKSTGKIVVLSIASDMDLSEAYTEESKGVNCYNSSNRQCYYAIKNADYIITQTSVQANLLKERFSRDSVTIPNPIDFGNTILHKDGKEAKYILWVGKAHQIKRPELYVRLAKEFMNVRFMMVMSCTNPSMYNMIIRDKPNNLKVIDYIPYYLIDSLFARAIAFVSTSDFEGFPNTFLQAGKHGVPVVSLNVDPDSFIERNNCGYIAHGDYDKLREGLDTVLKNKELAQEWSENIQAYVYHNHSLNAVVKKLDAHLKNILK